MHFVSWGVAANHACTFTLPGLNVRRLTDTLQQTAQWSLTWSVGLSQWSGIYTLYRARNYACLLAHDNHICHWTSEIATVCCLFTASKIRRFWNLVVHRSELLYSVQTNEPFILLVCWTWRHFHKLFTLHTHGESQVSFTDPVPTVQSTDVHPVSLCILVSIVQCHYLVGVVQSQFLNLSISLRPDRQSV